MVPGDGLWLTEMAGQSVDASTCEVRSGKTAAQSLLATNNRLVAHRVMVRSAATAEMGIAIARNRIMAKRVHLCEQSAGKDSALLRMDGRNIQHESQITLSGPERDNG